MSGKEDRSKGLYHNDYSPRYREAYNIYDKARDHMKRLKKEQKQSDQPDKKEK